MKKVFFFLFISLSLLWQSCANIVEPSGGAKDTQPPKIIYRSIKDSALNFKGGTISIDFDEHLQLQDLQNQLQITPLLKQNPEIKVKKRSLIIELPDSLLSDNTTYHISMGSALRDLREGNIFPDFQFTFSTGSYFDSLQLHGTVYEAQNGNVDTASKVFLYDASIADSLILKQKPMYESRLVQGNFQFQSLPDKKFKLVALRDVNKNYSYDSKGEWIAFYDQIIDIKKWAKDSALMLYSFIESSNVDSSKAITRGRNKPAKEEDSLRYFVKTNLSKDKLMDIYDSIKIGFNIPVKAINKNAVRLYEGDVLDATANIYLDTVQNELKINTQWKLETEYKLLLLKAFAAQEKTSINNDTLIVKTMKAKDYGSMIVQLDSSFEKKYSQFFVYQGEKIMYQSGLNNLIHTLPQLLPGTYNLRLLYDKNKNGKWDEGNFAKREQPEIVLQLLNPITIKANWENKVEWKLNEKRNAKN